MGPAEMKRRLVPGSVWKVTNHYITREDHPCFGTQTRTVEKATGSSFYFNVGGRLSFPKASQIKETPDGSINIYGHPKEGDLFLTLTPQG